MRILSNVWGVIGLVVGLGLAFTGLIVDWRRGKNNREKDERYFSIVGKASRISWLITSGMLITALAIVWVFTQSTLVTIILGLMTFIHFNSYWVTLGILSNEG